MNKTIHLCIATGHNAANFIPLKQLQAREVWILETPAMQEKRSAKALQTALKSKTALPDANVRILPFNDTTPSAMQEATISLADEELDGKDVVFHATGGTKLMVLSIHRQLLNLKAGDGHYRVLYADTQHQTLNWLDEQPSQQAMDAVLTLNEALLLRGYRTINDTRPAQIQQRASKRAEITRFMGEKSAQIGGFLGALNFHARNAADTGNLVREFDYLPRGAAGELLERAQEQAMLTVDDAYNEVTFASQEIAEYFSGGWAEEYVFLKFTGGLLAPTQYTSSAQIEQIGSKTRNEIDGLAVANNRVLIIECKTSRQHEAEDAIYKLGQLVKQVGGLMARGLYVSAREVNKANRNRAREYGVDVLAAKELGGLMDYLRRWAAPDR